MSMTERPTLIDTDKLSIAVRTRRGKRSLRAVEKEAGVSFYTIGRIEKGSIPEVETFIRVCRWLDMDMDYFVIDS